MPFFISGSIIRARDLFSAKYTETCPGLLSIWFILFYATLDYAFHFPEKGVEDYVKISSMPRSLTAVTVCLWMNSSSPKGSLVSYALSDTDNELLIDYNGCFEIQIGKFVRYSFDVYRRYATATRLFKKIESTSKWSYPNILKLSMSIKCRFFIVLQEESPDYWF